MSKAMMTDPAQIRAFVFAGNARITLVSAKTGNRFTYKVSKPRGEDGKVDHAGPSFVKVLSGPDNEGDYAYIGLYRNASLSYEHVRKSRVSEAADSVRAWRWFSKHVIEGDGIPAQLEVWHEGRCGRCGRVLTVPESIARGIGPECMFHCLISPSVTWE